VLLPKHVAPGNLVGVIFGIGVPVISTGLGVGLAAMTSVASGLAGEYFRNWPVRLTPIISQITRIRRPSEDPRLRNI
jgi:hypothetical protein